MSRHPQHRAGRLTALALAAAVMTVPSVAQARVNPSHPGVAHARAGATDPFRHLPTVPSFRLTSRSIRNDRPLPRAQWSAMSKLPGADDISPQLSWAPVRGAKSYAITMYDPQAPVEGGAVQWAVANIPGDVHSLAAGAGAPHIRLLPAGAEEVAASVGPGQYYGGAPLPHTGVHDYYFTVWALDVRHVGLTGGEPFGLFNFGLYEHTIARASIVCPTAAS